MSDRNLQYLTGFTGVGKIGVGSLGSQMNIFTTEPKVIVAHQRPGKQTTLSENLEPVANAQHPSARLGELNHAPHDGRKTSNSARAQIVTVRKSAWENHQVGVAEIL
jgi:hypothetical protein